MANYGKRTGQDKGIGRSGGGRRKINTKPCSSLRGPGYGKGGGRGKGKSR